MQSGDLLNGTYRVIEPIGHGGLGVVYLAYHENLKKYVVVKKIKSYMTESVNCRIEVDILKSLHHQFLPQVYDFVQVENGIFTVMDYISGHDLKYYLDAGCTFEEEQLWLWFRQLCEVLEYLHTRTPKIIHCDIKPGNIMITESGDVCLIDFNISLDGENNKELVGVSSVYASPEQIHKADLIMHGLDSRKINIDERSDIYSLGAVFYKLISDISPDERRKKQWILKNMQLAYSSSFVNIIDKCMMLEPSKRFQKAHEVLNAINHQERWTQEWLVKNKRARYAVCAGIFLVAAGISIGVCGYRSWQRKTFDKAYNDYMQTVQYLYEPLADDSDYQKIIDDGIGLLNNSDYQSLLKRYSVKKSLILYSVAQAEILNEDEVQAEIYLNEALEYDENNAEIYRDLAIISAKKQKLAYAQMYLDKAEEAGLSVDESLLVNAQIEAASQNWQKAYEMAVQTAQASDIEIARQSAILMIHACEQLHNYDEGIALAKKMYTNTNGGTHALWLEKCGELCVKAIDSNNDYANTKKDAYFKEGINCYTQLKNEGYEQLNAMKNLAFLYEKSGDLIECRTLLLDLVDRYPKDYTLPMELAYIYYRIENDHMSGRDYSKVLYYYELAKSICTEKRIDITQDSDMIALKNIIEQLKDNGLL